MRRSAHVAGSVTVRDRVTSPGATGRRRAEGHAVESSSRAAGAPGTARRGIRLASRPLARPAAGPASIGSGFRRLPGPAGPRVLGGKGRGLRGRHFRRLPSRHPVARCHALAGHRRDPAVPRVETPEHRLAGAQVSRQAPNPARPAGRGQQAVRPVPHGRGLPRQGADPHPRSPGVRQHRPGLASVSVVPDRPDRARKLLYLGASSWAAAEQNLAVAPAAERGESPALERLKSADVEFVPSKS